MSGQEQGQRQKRKLPKPPLGANSPNKPRSVSSLVQPSTEQSTNVTPIRTSSSASSVADTNRQLLNFSPPGTKPREFLGYTSPEPEKVSEWEDSSVTVAVRVRPFSEREIRLDAKQVIRMYKNETIVTAKENKIHRFCYDHCFWSFDDAQATFAGQDTVYRQLAQPLLDWAFEGYNTCLFAYGQTGSGKSYCVMGEPDCLGIVPRFCEELFERIEGTKTVETGYKVEVSYYEIYQEKIHDLLASTKRKSHKHLRVREHPVLGPYVEDLSTYVASSYADIEQWLALGNRFRATAATGMNERSSRSHSVFTVRLTVTEIIHGQEHIKVSRINLIDLAGSERSSVAQTSVERLKEGASINRSLHTLGKVISLLSEKSLGKRKKVYVPYRDSSLTWLLKESLGGNSKTAMIATISPADIHHDESLSTLRYAQQARSIVNLAKVNEDPNSKLIRQLREEIEALQGIVRQQRSAGGEGVTVLDANGSQEQVKELQRRLKEYEKLMKEQTISWEERLRTTRERKVEEAEQLKRAGVSYKVDNRLPNLVNLNEDPHLSEILLYILKEGVTTVGCPSQTNPHDIELTGALVLKNHCLFRHEAGEVSLEPSADLEAQTFLNGTLISADTLLHHGDRVVIGGEHFFRFNHPIELEKSGHSRHAPGNQKKDFRFAKEEFLTAQTARLRAEMEEKRLEEQEEMMRELQAIKLAAEEELEGQKMSYEDRLRQLEGTLVNKAEEVTERSQWQEEAEKKMAELERKNRLLEEETVAQKHIIELEKMKAQREYEEMAAQSSKLMLELEQEKLKLEGDISRLSKNKLLRDQRKSLPEQSGEPDLIEGSELLRIAMMLQEATVISRSLNRPFTFTRKAVYESGDSTIMVRVTNSQTGMITFWDLDKFEARLEQMREIHQMQGSSMTSLDPESYSEGPSDWLSSTLLDSDPFSDLQDEWLPDTSLTALSPLSSSQSLNRLLSSPLASPAIPPASSLPRRLVNLLASSGGRPTGSVSSSPLSTVPDEYSPTPSSSSSLVAQLCCDRIAATILEHQHSQTETTIVMRVTDCVRQLMNETHQLQEADTAAILNLYTTLEQLLEAVQCLDTVIGSASFDHGHQLLDSATPASVSSNVVTTVSQQTALHCSRLIQAVANSSKEEERESRRNLLESCEEIVSLLGQLSMAVMMEEQLELSRLFQASISDQQLAGVYWVGHQQLASCVLEITVQSLESSLDELLSLSSSPSLNKCGQEIAVFIHNVINSALTLLHRLAETQDLLWINSTDSLDTSTIDQIISLMATVKKASIQLNNLVSIGLQLPSISSSSPQLTFCNASVALQLEQVAVFLIAFLRQDDSNHEICFEIQGDSRRISMAVRALNQAAKKQGEHVAADCSLAGESSEPRVPAELLVASPAPDTDETDSSNGDQDDSDSQTDIV